MASTGEVCQQLREALRCLHAEATPGDLRRAAGGWLEGFQGSREAWSVCVACLLSTGEQVPVRVFAAQTMRFKVTRELGQLEVQHWAQLREMLLKCVQVKLCGEMRVWGCYLCWCMAECLGMMSGVCECDLKGMMYMWDLRCCIGCGRELGWLW